MLRKPTNELLIKPKMSAQVRLALIAGVLVLGAAALYGAYTMGVRSGHQQFQQDRLMLEQLDNTIVDLRNDLALAQEKMINAQRQQQIQEEAYRQISSAYASSEQKNSYLGSRLDFYRSIISPEDGQSGPAIQAAHASLENGAVVFDITLVQAIRHKHQVQGSLRVALYVGEQLSGQWPAGGPRSVNYQYFQQVSGTIEAVNLSENAKLKVELSVQGGDTIERWFDVAVKKL